MTRHGTVWMVLSLVGVLSFVVPRTAAAVSLDFTYTAALTQGFTTPTTGKFSEIGHAAFPQSSLSAVFTDAGTFSDSGLSGTFQTFNLQLYDGLRLVGTSSHLISGEARLGPDGTGSFDLTAAFTPRAPQYSGYHTLDMSGTIATLPGPLVGAYMASVQTGSGTLTLVNPEPYTVVLLGTGLTAIGWLLRWGRRPSSGLSTK